MLKSNLVGKPASTRSVNIRVIKPTGIKSVWNWFTNRSKKGNLQNIMFDKKFRLKLNIEELEALKRNGFDLQKLQITTNCEGKKWKKFVILPKDQSEMDKNVILNNNILCDLMKNKGVQKKTRKYKKSLITTSSLSIKSKNNVIDSTYIHSIKSKRSIINSGSSKASLKVGLKSTVAEDVQTNKNIIIKGIQEELLKRNMQKKVFVPIYLGKKKSSKLNKGDNENKVENKITNENESNVIPLLLSKLKTMEGQISGIENTTKKINEAVSQKNMVDVKNSSKTRGNQVQSSTKGLPTHKMYPKRSLKKFKPNKIESKSTTNSPETSLNNAYNTYFSLDKIENFKSNVTKLKSENKMTSIKYILDDPKHFLKNHTFVIPDKLSQKSLFSANPNVGCDVMLKLFEALTESNDSHHETSTDDNQTNIFFTNTSDSDSPKPNNSDVSQKLEMSSCTDKPKCLTSISESQLGILSKEADSENKNYSQPKKNISCPSSSTDISYKDKSDIETPTLENNVVTQQDNGQLHESKDDERNLFINESKSEQQGKKDKDTTNLPPSTDKSGIVFPKNELGVANRKFETMISTEKFEQEQNQKIKETNIFRPKHDSPLSEESKINFDKNIPENKLNFVQKIPEFKLFESKIKGNKTDCSNFKITEYNDLKSIELQVSEGQIEKQVIKVPIPTDSKNICSICIEPTLDLNLSKPSDIKGQSEINEANFCSDEIREPKLSITILVKNNLNDGMSSINNITSNIGSKKTSSLEAKGNHKWIKAQKSILTFNQEDSYNRLQGKGKNFNYNSDKYVPPLRLESFNTTPRSMASSGFVHRNSNNIDNLLNKPNLGQKTEFGIEGVSYLNQEQRKKLDTQLFKSGNDKLLNTLGFENLTSKIRKNTTLKQGAKRSINLKHNCPPIRHLSESSLYLKKINGKTVNKSIKNSRKSPYESLECLKIQNKLNTNNILEDYYTNNIKLPNNQQFDITHNKPLIRSKEFNILNTRNKQISINYSDVISSKEFITVKNKTEQKKDFYIVCKKKSTEDSRNTVISNLSCRKRSNRCSMTLKKPSLNNLDSKILLDKRGKVDHQARNIELISTKEITTSGEIFQNTGRICHSPNKETASINHVGEDPTLIIRPSQPSSPTKENHLIDSLPSSGMPKCQNNLAKAAESCANKDLNYQPGVQPTPKISDISADSTLLAKFGDEAIGVTCFCVFSNANTSIPEGASGSQPSIIEQLQLRPLSIDALPMACPCIIEKAKAASESWIRSQTEILMNKSMPHRVNRCWQLYLICKNCASKLDSTHNGDTKTLESNEETFNKQNHEAINGTKLNSNSDFNCHTQSEPHVLINEKAAEVFDSKSIECQSQSATNENNSYSLLKSPVDNLLDDKLQNDLRDEKREPCFSTCLKIPSDEGSCSDTSDTKLQNSFCLNAIPEPDCSNEHIAKKDVAKGIIHHLCKINGGYKVENITHSTTVYHFSDEEEFTSIKEVPKNPAMTGDGSQGIGDYSKCMEYKESYENKKYMEQKENNNLNYKYDEVNNERRSYINVNHIYEDPYRNIAVTRSTQPPLKDQIRYKNTNLEAGDGCFPHISPAFTCRSVKSNSEYNKQLEYEYLAKNNQVFLNMNTYKSFERSMLKTIKENDSRETGFDPNRDYVKYVPTERPKVLMSSTDYVVNCLHSIEYDITSENRNSLYRCSVNAYSSSNSKK